MREKHASQWVAVTARIVLHERAKGSNWENMLNAVYSFFRWSCPFALREQQDAGLPTESFVTREWRDNVYYGGLTNKVYVFTDLDNSYDPHLTGLYVDLFVRHLQMEVMPFSRVSPDLMNRVELRFPEAAVFAYHEEAHMVYVVPRGTPRVQVWNEDTQSQMSVSDYGSDVSGASMNTEAFQPVWQQFLSDRSLTRVYRFESFECENENPPGVNYYYQTPEGATEESFGLQEPEEGRAHEELIQLRIRQSVSSATARADALRSYRANLAQPSQHWLGQQGGVCRACGLPDHRARFWVDRCTACHRTHSLEQGGVQEEPVSGNLTANQAERPASEQHDFGFSPSLDKETLRMVYALPEQDRRRLAEALKHDQSGQRQILHEKVATSLAGGAPSASGSGGSQVFAEQHITISSDGVRHRHGLMCRDCYYTGPTNLIGGAEKCGWCDGLNLASATGPRSQW